MGIGPIVLVVAQDFKVGEPIVEVVIRHAVSLIRSPFLFLHLPLRSPILCKTRISHIDAIEERMSTRCYDLLVVISCALLTITIGSMPVQFLVPAYGDNATGRITNPDV
jgi:hypothetical protein